MSTNVVYDYRRSQSLIDRIWAAMSAFLNKVAEINARNREVEPFGL